MNPSAAVLCQLSAFYNRVDFEGENQRRAIKSLKDEKEF